MRRDGKLKPPIPGRDDPTDGDARSAPVPRRRVPSTAGRLFCHGPHDGRRPGGVTGGGRRPRQQAASLRQRARRLRLRGFGDVADELEAHAVALQETADAIATQLEGFAAAHRLGVARPTARPEAPFPTIQGDGVACAMYVAKQSRSWWGVICLSRDLAGALTHRNVQT